MSDPQVPDPVPAELAGRWIAWSSDGLRIVGHGDSIESAQESAVAGGFAVGPITWIPSADELRGRCGWPDMRGRR